MVLGSPSFYIVCNLASDLSRDYKCHVTTLDFGVLCRSVEASRLLREETIDATVLENSLKKSHLETIMFSHRKSIFECSTASVILAIFGAKIQRFDFPIVHTKHH